MKIYLSSLWLAILKKYIELFPDSKINVLVSFAALVTLLNRLFESGVFLTRCFV
jgi:hypothetical protein